MRIDKVWSASNFLKLDKDSKLLYLHLMSHPELTEFGTVSLDINMAQLQTGLDPILFRTATKSLIDSNMLVVKKVEESLYFIILDFFNKSSKSIATKERLLKKIHTLPVEIRQFIEDHTKIDLVVVTQKEPTPTEVEEYAISQGHNINGSEFIDYYKSMAAALGHNVGFYDKNGRKVVDWKAKLRKVWFKDTNKLKEVKGAPKEHLNFSVKAPNGTLIYPDYWDDEGRPRSKDFSADILLRKHFGTNEKSKNSRRSTRS